MCALRSAFANTPPLQVGIYSLSTGLDWRCSAEVQEITFNPRNSLLILPNPVREERHEHEMGNDLLFLFHPEGPGVGKIG